MENQISDFVIFIGRFHPLIVHLPIGFLILGFILHLVAKFEKFKNSEHIVDFTLLIGGISAFGACVLGYMLSLEGGYGDDAIFIHQWSGIALTIISFILLAIRKWQIGNLIVQRVGFILVMIVLTLTGHFGGNLTHGSTYLVQYAPNPIRVIAGLPPKIERIYRKIDHIDSALVFEDVLMPILDARCMSCHNEEKLKGELLLTSLKDLMKGGESGKAIVPGKSAASELFKRITLAHDDEDFMPPEGKTPLSKEQVKMIEWWIDEGAKPKASMISLNASSEIKDRFEKYLHIGKYMTLLNDPIDPIDPSIIEEIESSGFTVSVLAETVNYLDVTVKNGVKISKKQLETLEQAKEHIVWLDLKNSGLEDDYFNVINSLPNLLKLRVDRNEITDNGVNQLTDLNNLEYINLSFTKITDASLASLNKLEKLNKTYYYSTGVKDTAGTN